MDPEEIKILSQKRWEKHQAMLNSETKNIRSGKSTCGKKVTLSPSDSMDKKIQDIVRSRNLSISAA